MIISKTVTQCKIEYNDGSDSTPLVSTPAASYLPLAESALGRAEQVLLLTAVRLGSHTILDVDEQRLLLTGHCLHPQLPSLTVILQPVCLILLLIP